MKITLILPPRLMVQGYLTPEAYPPLGLALIAGSLLKVGHDINVIDSVGEAPEQHNSISPELNSTKFPNEKKMLTVGLSFEEIAARIPSETEVIAISCMFTFNWISDRELLKFLHQKFPQTLFIGGGESITGLAEECLRQSEALSLCVVGEGEDTIIDLIDALDNKRDLSSVQSIIYKQNNEILKTPRRARIKNLEAIPFPAWELFPVQNYPKQKRSNKWENPEPSLPIMATRGCPFICTFCTSPDMWGTRYYMRSPEHVIEEIEYLKNNFNATIIEFFDLTAIIKKDWIIKFSQLLIEKNLDIAWRIPAGTRSEAIDAEVAYHLKKSGCYQITYAPESGSPRLLKLIKKKVNLDNMLKSIKDSKKEGLHVDLNMIMGLPDETHLDIWKTTWFMIKCARLGVDNVPLHMYRPYPGSVLFDRNIKEHKVQVENDDYLVDSLFTIVSSFESTVGGKWSITYYNENVNKRWYEFYHKMMLTVFYISKYILRPSYLTESYKNIMTNNYRNNFERDLASKVNVIRNIRAKTPHPLIIFKHQRFQKYYWQVYTPMNIYNEIKIRFNTRIQKNR